MTQTVFPTIDAITRNQIDLLLDVISSLRPMLASDGQEGGALDGGTQAVAAATFIKATSRLDSILEENDRWATKAANDVLAAMVKTHEKQQHFLTEQALGASEVRRPSFQLRPSLLVHEGRYYALWGELGDPGSIVGEGNTPSEALRDFDAAFTREASKQVKLEAVPEEPIPPTPLTVKPRRKK